MTNPTIQVNQLRATLSKMEIALGTVEECIVWTDGIGRIKWCNAALSRFLGQPNLMILGQLLTTKLPLQCESQPVPVEHHPVSLAFSTHATGKQEYEFLKAGTRLVLEITWSFVEIREDLASGDDAASAVLVIRDITQQKLAEVKLKESNEHLEHLVTQRTQELTEANRKLEQEAAQLQHILQELQHTQAQLIQAEKMSSLGQLVAGIAHEVNNPVNFIHGNLTYLQEGISILLDLIQLYQQNYPQPIPAIQSLIETEDLEFLQQDLPKSLRSLQTGTDRIRQIVLSLRNFSRMDESHLKPVDVHEGIESTVLILQHRLTPPSVSWQIEIIRDYGNLPLVECYPGQLNQVFMNILANAIDAIEEATQSPEFAHPDVSKQITIRTSRLDDEWVEIAIANTGFPIPESVQRQLFNPFFTTKPIGKGTGMGMAISYQIVVDRHQGKLLCQSAPHQDTTFIVRLPIYQSSRGLRHARAGHKHQAADWAGDDSDHAVAEFSPMPSPLRPEETWVGTVE